MSGSIDSARQLLRAISVWWRGLFWVGLLALLGIQFTFGRPPSVAVLFSAPLFICTVACAVGALKARGATGLMILIYFVHGLTETVANPHSRSSAIGETIACLAIYLSLLGMAHTIRRWRTQQSDNQNA